MHDDATVQKARMRLVEEGGRAAQDLGFSRIGGQILVYLYLSEGERSLDDIVADLGLSKAAASIAARQLDTLGLLRRGWRAGDRKVYYRTADNLGDVFRDGVAGMVRRKVTAVATELDRTGAMLGSDDDQPDPERRFLAGRIVRARQICGRVERVLGSRLWRFLAR